MLIEEFIQRSLGYARDDYTRHFDRSFAEGGRIEKFLFTYHLSLSPFHLYNTPMKNQFLLYSLAVVILSACSVVKGTVDGVSTVGKVAWGTAKVTGKVVKTTGDVAYHTSNAMYKTGKATSKAVRTVVYIAKGKQIIPLDKVGNSLYAHVRLGRAKRPARLLVDTGASATQITAQMARELGINLNRAESTAAQLANGQIVTAKEVIIPSIYLGGVKVSNVRALVLDQILGDSDGLLGMSFLNHFVFQIDADVPELVLQQKAK